MILLLLYSYCIVINDIIIIIMVAKCENCNGDVGKNESERGGVYVPQYGFPFSDNGNLCVYKYNIFISDSNIFFLLFPVVLSFTPSVGRDVEIRVSVVWCTSTETDHEPTAINKNRLFIMFSSARPTYIPSERHTNLKSTAAV